MVCHFIVSTVLIFSVMERQRDLQDKKPGDLKAEGFLATRRMFIDYYKDQNHPGMDDSFCFALYESLNLDRILSDFCNFHVSAWILLLIVKAIECCIMGILIAPDTAGNFEWYQGPFLSWACAILSPLVVGFVVFKNKRAITGYHRNGRFAGVDAKGGCWKYIGEHYDLEIWTSRMFQALTFTLSYEFMRSFGGRLFWNGDRTTRWPMSRSASLPIYIIPLFALVLINARLLPKGIKYITLLYSLPPYVDKVRTQPDLQLI